MDESAWRAVLDSGFGAGLLRGRTDKTERAKNTRPDTYDVWADGAHEALISQSLWDAYVDRRLRQANAHTRDSTPKYALSGLVRCGDLRADGTRCGMAMKVTGQSRRGKERVRYFTCVWGERHKRGSTLSMGMHRIEAVVNDWLLAGAAGGEALAQISMDRAAAAKRSAAEIPTIKQIIRDLERKKNRINEGWEAGLTELEEAKSRMDAVRVELTEKKEQLRRLEEEAASNLVPEREVFQGLLVVWGRATAEEKRRALRKVIDHILVTPPAISDADGSTAEIVPRWADPSRRIQDKRKRSPVT